MESDVAGFVFRQQAVLNGDPLQLRSMADVRGATRVSCDAVSTPSGKMKI
ncbi:MULTISPECIES: hypothetical protein [Serratia]|nr:hypothetical protein [Serratia fonticola]